MMLTQRAPARDMSLDALAAIAPRPEITIEQLDEVADLARRITQRRAREAGMLLGEHDAVPYSDQHPDRRAAQRLGVLRVIQAMMLLGWIEQP